MTAIATLPARTERSSGVWTAVGVATLAAAAATEALVALAKTVGITVAIQGEELKAGGCAVVVLMCMVAGVALLAGLRRWAASPARTWTRATVALTALSFVPDLVVPDTAVGSRIVLMTAHVLAAAIIVPAVARRLPTTR
ncbi:MAG: hypothetical protein QOI15_2336 [Pseudonocardiales bacterium]|jgi:hypothetical protein|nr:hypothetical protein [Pseudonocardiales bacterium]